MERERSSQAAGEAPLSPGWSLRRVAAICALILAATLAAALLTTSGDGTHRYNFLFPTAGQLVTGNQVYIGGKPVGGIEEIELTDDGLARVEVSVSQQLHEGTTATIRATSLSGVANRYVSVSPGPNNGPALGQGATIGPEATEAPVELDSVLNAFKPGVRQGLRNFIKGNAAIYAGKGPQANETYKYLAPALGNSRRWMEELGRDQRLFEEFVINSSKLVTAIAARSSELSSSIGRARRTFGAVAEQSASLDQALDLLPDTFRQANTTFFNLRDALDDVDPLVATAKPATRDLAPFLRRATPVVGRAVPVFRKLGLALNRAPKRKRKPKANDAAELLKGLPPTRGRASGVFPQAARAARDFQPTLDFARPYMPDVMQALAKLGQITGYYDANGHYARILVADANLFDWNEVTGQLEPIPPSAQYDEFGPPQVFRRCPGAATQSAADNSNPFVAPLWPESDLDASDCNPADLPPGP